MSAAGFPEPAFMADEEIRMFADSVGKFLDRNAPPERIASWREAGMVERAFWREAGEAGLLGVSVPEAYGGPGGDFRHDVVVAETIIRMTGSKSRIVQKPLPTDDPKQRRPDITRATTLLKWEPKVQLEEGLVHADPVVRVDDTRAERDGRDVTFACRPQTEDEAA